MSSTRSKPYFKGSVVGICCKWYIVPSCPWDILHLRWWPSFGWRSPIGWCDSYRVGWYHSLLGQRRSNPFEEYVQPSLYLFASNSASSPAFESAPGPIAATAFNRNGSIFAYAISYDWSKGHSGMTPGHPNKLMLHACKDDEVKKRPARK